MMVARRSVRSALTILWAWTVKCIALARLMALAANALLAATKLTGDASRPRNIRATIARAHADVRVVGGATPSAATDSRDKSNTVINAETATVPATATAAATAYTAMALVKYKCANGSAGPRMRGYNPRVKSLPPRSMRGTRLEEKTNDDLLHCKSQP